MRICYEREDKETSSLFKANQFPIDNFFDSFNQFNFLNDIL